MAGINMSVTLSKRGAKKGLKEYIFEQLKTLWRDCVSAFIFETTRHIKVDTGMSEASLYDLATNVRIANQVIADIHGKGPSKPHPAYVDMQGIAHPGVNKSIPFGQELGRQKAYELEFGTFQIPDLLFKFKIVIYQYKLHEKYGWGDSVAWNSLKYGKKAFITCWHANFKYRIKTRKILEFLTPG